MPPDRLPVGAAEGAPVVLPGLVMATAVRMGDQVNFVPMSSILELGGTEVVWATAMKNVENLNGLQVIREAFDPDRADTEVVTIWSDDPFVASRIVVLDWLVEHIYGMPAVHGALVAVPSTTRLILHVVSGVGVLKAAKDMVSPAVHWFETAGTHERISPDVYLVSPDRRAQRVAYATDDDRIYVNTTGLFGEILFGPPPAGLGLKA